MSEANPPDFFFNGINFNPSFFRSCVFNDGGISLTFANNTYIRKAGDTITGTQNFLMPVKSSSIESLSTTTPATLYGTLNNTLNILNNANTNAILNINRPITLNYSYGSLTSFSQSGYTTSTTGTATNILVGTTTNLLALPSVDPGSYIYNYHVPLTVSTASVTVSRILIGFSLTSSITDVIPGIHEQWHSSMTYTAGDVPIFSGCGIFNNIGGQAVNLLIIINFTGTGTISGTGTGKILRIG